MENNLKTFYRFTTMLDFLSFDYLNNQNEIEKNMFHYEHFYPEDGNIGSKFISLITPKSLGFDVKQKKHIIKNVKLEYVFLNNNTLELNISLNFRNLTQAELSLFESEHRESIHSFIQDISVGNIDFSKDYNIQYNCGKFFSSIDYKFNVSFKEIFNVNVDSLKLESIYFYIADLPQISDENFKALFCFIDSFLDQKKLTKDGIILTENICNDFRKNNFIFDKDFEDYMELTYGK
tara:strand:+ start:10563 stop:11267 length:705 start_codon:yes stop_codon:yes gene_type:complete